MKRRLAQIDWRNHRMINLLVGADSEEERIPVYDQLLRNSSPKFKSLVEAMIHETQDLALPGVSKKIMFILIEYIHQTFEDGEASLPITEENVLELLFAANKYDLDDVKTLCCNFLEFVEINEENCIQLFVKAPELTSANFRKKCLEFILSSLGHLFATRPFVNLNFTQLVSIVREGRVQSKCLDDLLCETAINWIKSNSSMDLSQVVIKELIDQFQLNKHKQIIIKALYDIPKQRDFAFNLSLESWKDETETTTATNVPLQTDHYDDPSTSESCGQSYDGNNDDSASISNDSNSSSAIDSNEQAAHVTPLKRPSTSTHGNNEGPFFSQQNVNISPVAKISKKTEILEDINNESQLTFNSSLQKNDRQRTLTTLKYLPYDDLHSFDWIALPHWSPPEAEFTNRQSPLLSISLQRTTAKSTIVKTFRSKKTIHHFQNISKLSEELETLGNVREIWLQIWNVQLSSDEIKKFLDKFASDICILTLEGGVLDRMSPSDLQQLLSKLPNLNYLCLKEIPSDWKAQKQTFVQPNSTSAQSDKLNLLPQVKIVAFDDVSEFYPEFLKSLFKILPNLNNVHNFPLYCSNILTTDVLDKIRSVRFSSVRPSILPTANTNLEHQLTKFEKLSQKTKLESAVLGFKLSSLENPKDLWKSCCESLSSIFRNNQSTLDYLVIQPLPYPELLEYPEMEAVKKLCLINPLNWKKCENAAKQVKFFGKGFDARKSFPNLVEVTLKGTGCGLDHVLLFFPEEAFSQQYFQRVARLNIECSDYEKVDALEKAAKLFPGVTSWYTNGDIRWLEKRMPHIVRLWPKLASLKVNVDVFHNARSRVVSEYPLDPIFTGIPPEKCNELRQHKEKRDIDSPSYRQNSGLSTMADLKELTLIFSGEYLKTYKVMPLLSHVSSFYGFQCLPDLKVTCAIPWDNKDNDKIQEMLSPIQKYITFNPNYY